MKQLFFMKCMLKTAFIYRSNVVFTSLGNALYLYMSYFLWRSVYSSNTLEGYGDFEYTFIGICLASTIVIFYRTNTEWYISERVISGNITTELVKPLKLIDRYFFISLGELLFNFLVIFLPIFIFVSLLYDVRVNDVFLIIILIGLIFGGYIINFLINFIIGMISIFTHSVWGISTVKDSVILIMSGAVIPISFFGESVLQVFKMTPFHYMVYLPSELIRSGSYDLIEIKHSFLVQAAWIGTLYILSLLLEPFAQRKIVVNGG